MHPKQYHLDTMGIPSWVLRKPDLQSAASQVFHFGNEKADLFILFFYYEKNKNPFTADLKTLLIQMLKSIAIEPDGFYALAFHQSSFKPEHLSNTIKEIPDRLLILDDTGSLDLESIGWLSAVKTVKTFSPYHLINHPKDKKTTYQAILSLGRVFRGI